MTGGYKFSFGTSQRTVIDVELHGDGRLGDLLERDRLRLLRGAEGITDVDIRDTGDRNDLTDRRTLYFNSLYAIEYLELTDLYFLHLVRIMMVYDHAVLI